MSRDRPGERAVSAIIIVSLPIPHDHDNDIVMHHDEYLLSLDSVSAYALQLIFASLDCIAYNGIPSRRESGSQEMQKRALPKLY